VVRGPQHGLEWLDEWLYGLGCRGRHTRWRITWPVGLGVGHKEKAALSALRSRYKHRLGCVQVAIVTLTSSPDVGSLCAASPLLCTPPEGRTHPAETKCGEAARFDLDFVVQSATRNSALQVSPGGC
jgi:hypothetical protein